MYNIDAGRIIWKNIKRMFLTSDEVKEYQLAPDDLLVNRVNSRELVGKTAVFPTGLEPCVYESKNIRVRLLSELVNSDFVNYQLLLFGQHHFNFFNYNSQQVVGMASISQPQIGNFPLLIPPRIEQDRIVSKVQAMLPKLAKSSSHIANVAKTLKRFRQAVLAAACSGRLTEDWREVHREELESLLNTIHHNNGERFQVSHSYDCC
jgi:type I restriction enzyme S subunit